MPYHHHQLDHWLAAFFSQFTTPSSSRFALLGSQQQASVPHSVLKYNKTLVKLQLGQRLSRKRKRRRSTKERKERRRESSSSMSWQTYVDDHLMVPLGVGQKPLIGAAILGHDGSIWAQSAAFPQVRTGAWSVMPAPRERERERETERERQRERERKCMHVVEKEEEKVVSR